MTTEEKQKDPSHQILIGANPASGVQWIQLEFQQNDSGNGKASWELRTADFALSRKEGDSDQLYDDFKSVLEARLAKLGKLKTFPLDTGVGWNLGDYKAVDIQKGSFNNPVTKQLHRVVLIGMTIQDEEEPD
jgi:hypothetical protein